MNRQEIVDEINELICEGEKSILPTKWWPELIGASYMVDGPMFYGWHAKIVTLLNTFLPDSNDYLKRITGLKDNYYSYAESCIQLLRSLTDYIEKGIIVPGETNEPDADESLKIILSRLHRVARQLRNRYNDRPTLDLNDEYDVQDLLHALLKLYFDDIRAEEWTPSYAGKSARMDFLLKKEGIVIEVKKTRRGLSDKEVGDQLIIDVERYKIHPDCRKLICFIYDPEGRIGNPEGLIKDLNDQHEGFVEVFIEPYN